MRSALAACFAALVLVAAGGCTESTEEPAEPAAPAASARRDRPTEVEMVASMEAHYGLVILAHDALIHGDLDAFRAQLARAAEQQLPPSAPAAWGPYHEPLRAAAGSGAEAEDLEQAAHALAEVVRACGTCHAALDAGPVYPAPAPGDGETVVETAMLDHQWATERLWEGVTGPWDGAWQRGADALAETRVFGDLGEGVTLADALREREEALRAIGREAKTTDGLDARAALYGRLLATCGDCHLAAGVEFAPPE